MTLRNRIPMILSDAGGMTVWQLVHVMGKPQTRASYNHVSSVLHNLERAGVVLRKDPNVRPIVWVVTGEACPACGRRY